MPAVFNTPAMYDAVRFKVIYYLTLDEINAMRMTCRACSTLPIFYMRDARGLKQKDVIRHKYTEYLDLRNNASVISVNKLPNLSCLSTSELIASAGYVSCTKLTMLDTFRSGYIEDDALGHFPLLTTLYAGENITQKHLGFCPQLELLHICKDCSVFSANCFNRLVHLTVDSILTQEGIQHITTLQTLIMSKDSTVYDLNHMADLQELCVGSHMTQDGIDYCTKIRKLDIHHCDNIYDLSHLHELSDLCVCPSFNQDGLDHCASLRRLDMYHCENINYLAWMATTLQELHIGKNTEMSLIAVCRSLRVLVVHHENEHVRYPDYASYAGCFPNLYRWLIREDDMPDRDVIMS